MIRGKYSSVTQVCPLYEKQCVTVAIRDNGVITGSEEFGRTTTS